MDRLISFHVARHNRVMLHGDADNAPVVLNRPRAEGVVLAYKLWGALLIDSGLDLMALPTGAVVIRRAAHLALERPEGREETRGRKPAGERAMTAVERQRAYRARLKERTKA